MDVTAQAVPPHIGSPTPGCGYEDGDPYPGFLPPPLETDQDGNAPFHRAVVFITSGTRKGTDRHPQEYVEPLFVLSGTEYANIAFNDLLGRLQEAVRSGPRVVAEFLGPTGQRRSITDDDLEHTFDGEYP